MPRKTWKSLDEEGQLQTKLGNHREAIESFTAAIQLNPKYATLYARRGLVKLYLEMSAEASEDTKKAVDLCRANNYEEDWDYIKYTRVKSEVALEGLNFNFKNTTRIRKLFI